MNDDRKQGEQQGKGQQQPKQGQQQPKQGQQQQQGGAQGQYGEGNYKATRQYNEGLKDHVQHHDIEKEARDAAPKSDAEQREMDEAERVGKSKSKAGREDGTREGDGKKA